jgi:uncharacterized protein
MKKYFARTIEKDVLRYLDFFPAVGILGPRQVGKTSLVQEIRQQLTKPSIYLDLENPDDLFKLENPNLFLEPLADHTVILDEVQRVPKLFLSLRGLIDRNRVPGRFLLLGSASPLLIRDSSETLAGRVSYLELFPLSLQEVSNEVPIQVHWLRGGFPDALLAPSDDLVWAWYRSFIRTYLERDLTFLGLDTDPLLISRLMQMLAHLSGQQLNISALSNNLDLNYQKLVKYIDFLESAFLIRRLSSFYTNIGKRLVKTPKLYFRDTGLLHAMLSINSQMDLLGHPAIGASWESYVVEQVHQQSPDWAGWYYYRTQDGSEADLVLTKGGQPIAVIEIKYAAAPSLSKGFFIAAKDLKVSRLFVICPVEKGFTLSNQVEVLGINELGRLFD